MPAGLPEGADEVHDAEGDRRADVRAAAAPTVRKYASVPFDPTESFHATHVAGIAAGDDGTHGRQTRTLSGVAPHAYLGNYKALTIPTPSFGLDGNAAEIAAAIEAAVADGMDVINLSLGEPEIEPARDIVVHGDRRRRRAPASSRSSPPGTTSPTSATARSARPASSAKAITVAAVTSAST